MSAFLSEIHAGELFNGHGLQRRPDPLGAQCRDIQGTTVGDELGNGGCAHSALAGAHPGPGLPFDLCRVARSLRYRFPYLACGQLLTATDNRCIVRGDQCLATWRKEMVEKGTDQLFPVIFFSNTVELNGRARSR